MPREIILAKKYRLGTKIGSGAFGDIYSGSVISSGEPIAIKLEVSSPSPSPLFSLIPQAVDAKKPQLEWEFKIYRCLAGSVGIPNAYYFGCEGDYNVMVMDMCGKSLEDLFCRCGRRFGLKTTLMIADQLICRMEIMHAKNHIHRDIKPDNFVIGRGKHSKLIYVIDLGLAKRFRDADTRKHIPFKEGLHLFGSARYMALDVHLGREQSRKTDMESLGYTILYFVQGRLPWQGFKDEGHDKYEKIRQVKAGLTSDQLCKDLPVEFALYFDHVKSLGFEDRPDYDYLKRLFRDLFYHEGFEFDSVYDWDLL